MRPGARLDVKSTIARLSTIKSLWIALFLAMIGAATMVSWQATEPEQVAGTTEACSSCDARHSGLEARIEAVRKLREQEKDDPDSPQSD